MEIGDSGIKVIGTADSSASALMMSTTFASSRRSRLTLPLSPAVSKARSAEENDS